MTFGRWLRESLKEGRPVQFLHCSKCGGSYGTLIRKGSKQEHNYEHLREIDCELHRRRYA
jgi:transcription elongation factor Elf1